MATTKQFMLSIVIVLAIISVSFLWGRDILVMANIIYGEDDYMARIETQRGGEFPFTIYETNTKDGITKGFDIEIESLVGGIVGYDTYIWKLVDYNTREGIPREPYECYMAGEITTCQDYDYVDVVKQKMGWELITKKNLVTLTELGTDKSTRFKIQSTGWDFAKCDISSEPGVYPIKRHCKVDNIVTFNDFRYDKYDVWEMNSSNFQGVGTNINGTSLFLELNRSSNRFPNSLDDGNPSTQGFYPNASIMNEHMSAIPTHESSSGEGSHNEFLSGDGDRFVIEATSATSTQMFFDNGTSPSRLFTAVKFNSSVFSSSQQHPIFLENNVNPGSGIRERIIVTTFETSPSRIQVNTGGGHGDTATTTQYKSVGAMETGKEYILMLNSTDDSFEFYAWEVGNLTNIDNKPYDTPLTVNLSVSNMPHTDHLNVIRTGVNTATQFQEYDWYYISEEGFPNNLAATGDFLSDGFCPIDTSTDVAWSTFDFGRFGNTTTETLNCQTRLGDNSTWSAFSSNRSEFDDIDANDACIQFRCQFNTLDTGLTPRLEWMNITFDTTEQIPPTVTSVSFFGVINTTLPKETIFNITTVQEINYLEVIVNITDASGVNITPESLITFMRVNQSGTDFCDQTTDSSNGTIGNLGIHNGDLLRCYDFIEVIHDMDSSTFNDSTNSEDHIDIELLDSNATFASFIMNISQQWKNTWKNYPINHQTDNVSNFPIFGKAGNTAAIRMKIDEIVTDASFYQLVIPSGKSAGTIEELHVYLYNESYTGGRWDNNVNVLLIGTLEPEEVFDDAEPSIVFTNNTIDILGGTFSGFIFDQAEEANSANAYFLEMADMLDNEICIADNHTSYTTNRGTSFDNLCPTTATAHLHWFYEGQEGNMKFNTQDLNSNRGNSSLFSYRFDRFTSINLPPATCTIIIPEFPENLTSNFTITLNAGADSNLDALSHNITFTNSTFDNFTLLSEATPAGIHNHTIDARELGIPDGYLGWALLTLIWLMVYMSFSNKPPKHGIAAASWTTALLSGLLFILEINQESMFMLSIIFVIVAIIASYGETVID